MLWTQKSNDNIFRERERERDYKLKEMQFAEGSNDVWSLEWRRGSIKVKTNMNVTDVAWDEQKHMTLTCWA